MRVSELATHTGVSVPTVKYYIREGMLAPGDPAGPRRATYNDSHVQRIRLIQALTGPAGLSLSEVKAILQIIDEPTSSLIDPLAAATRVLADAAGADINADERSYPRAQQAVGWLGEPYRAEPPAAALLEKALQAVETAGFQLDPNQFAVYGKHMLAIAASEIANMPSDPVEAVQYAVLGTVLFEPVLTAIRRLAHQSLVKRGSDT
ncbi:MAG: MerR family transcriptional regulator [Mycobacterium sp.]|nr:MerR family transcriptional regulator [Mycobacterium sp.]MBV8292857.1 MerR family transcriptional regulator [Mycobacterium sp.]